MMRTMKYLAAAILALLPLYLQAPAQGQSLPASTLGPTSVDSLTIRQPDALKFFPKNIVEAIKAGSITTNVTSYLQAGLDALDAAGGGTFVLPKGTYFVCNLQVGANIEVKASPFGSVLKATPNCGQGPINSKKAWRDIRRLLYADAAEGATSLVVGEAEGIVTGHQILLQSNNGAFRVYATIAPPQQNTPSPGLVTLLIDRGVEIEAARGNYWRDINDPAITNVTIQGLEIDGNDAAQPSSYGNVINTTVPPVAGLVPLNGGLVIGGTAYFTPNSNLVVRVCTTAAEGGKTITIAGRKSMGSYARVNFNYVQTLPSAGCTELPFNQQFNAITSVTLSANMTGNLFVGVADGPESGNCMTFSAPFFRVYNTQMLHCKGWGFRSDWTAGGGGFNSAYATQQGLMDAVDAELVGQGAFWINGPNDSKFSKLVGGFNRNYGIWFDRNSPGSDLFQSHFSGANDGVSFKQPFYGVVVDADTISLTDVKSEEAYVAQVVVRANNATILGGNYFAPQIMKFGQQSSCIQIGDAAYNDQGLLAYDIHTRGKQCGAAGILFTPGLDGGWGSVKLLGDDYETALKTAAAQGATSIELVCGACTDLFAPNMNVILTLDSGVQSIILGAYNSGNKTWATTALTGAAAQGNKLLRGRSIAGTPSVVPGFRSDIDVFMPYGAYPPSFIQKRND